MLIYYKISFVKIVLKNAIVINKLIKTNQYIPIELRTPLDDEINQRDVCVRLLTEQEYYLVRKLLSRSYLWSIKFLSQTLLLHHTGLQFQRI